MCSVSAAASASCGELLEAGDALVRVVPEVAQEAAGEADRAVAPVQRLRRPRRVEHGQPNGVGAVLGDQLVGVDDVAEVLAHLAAVGDHHLVEEAAGEGLPLLHEGEGADVAQRLGDDALVEDEAAAVVAGDEALGGQPLLQLGVGEHLLVAVLGRDRGRDPEPERVEVAVEGVGLALGGAAALRALDVDEVRALGQRVPFPGRHEVAREDDRQVLLGDRDRSALLAEDDRDRRSPGALARDREVVGAVAGRLAGARDRRGGGRLSPSSTGSGTRDAVEPLGEVAVGLVDGGDAERRGRPEAGVDERRDDDRQLLAVGPVIEAPVSTSGTERASRALRSQPPERICSSSSRAAGSATQASTSGWRGESRTKLASPACSRWGVKTVRARPSPSCRSISTPSARPRM